MAKGGARVRSGPDADPNSGRSDRVRRVAKKAAAAKPPTSSEASASPSSITTTLFNATALPARGRGGNPPAYPLPKMTRPVPAATEAFRKRELAIWREVWKTPQAVAWERESYRWSTIAEFCRLKTIVEAEPDSNAALVARLREYRNECGLSPDGLKANGWAIAPDELAEHRAKKATATKKTAAAPPSRRLRG